MSVLNFIFFKQTLLFLRPPRKDGTGGTLSGNKLDAYVLLKIFKLLFGVSITSFILKFTIDRALEEEKYEIEDIGRVFNINEYSM